MAAPMNRLRVYRFLRSLNASKAEINPKSCPLRCHGPRQFTLFTQSKKIANNSSLKVALGVATFGGLSAAAVFREHLWDFNTVLAATETPNVSRSVPGLIDLGKQQFTLYQFQSCPYCCKVRAALDYFGFPYDVVEVNSVTKQQIKFSDYKKVPLLVVSGQDESGNDFSLQFNDSSLIVSMLASYVHGPRPLNTLHSCYPSMQEKEGRKTVWKFPNKYFVMLGEQYTDNQTDKERISEREWRKWTDDILMHTISPNVYRSLSESLEAFRHFSDWGEWDKNFSTASRLFVVYVGTVAMFLVAKFVKRKYKIDENPRVSLYAACNEWLSAVGKQQFYGGDKPNLADLAVYGALHSFEGCRAHKDMMIDTKIQPWYERMEKEIGTNQGAALITATTTQKPGQKS